MAFRDLDAFWGRREAIRGLLLYAAAFGIASALPPVRFPSRHEAARELLDAAEGTFVEVGGRAQRATAALDGAAAAPDPVAALVEALRAAFGEAFAALPRFTLPAGQDLREALDRGLAGEPEVDAWMAGATHVREGAAHMARIRLLADAFGAPPLGAGVVQLPGADGAPWLGGPWPAGHVPLADQLSLAVVGQEALAAAGANVAVLADGWDERVPEAEQTTGVAFHYDQPDARPPQSLLLAVPPRPGAAWRVEDLVQTLHDTLELAKNRAVELEHLQDDLYGQLLPAVIGELVPEAITGTTTTEIPGSRVVLDFGANNPPAAAPS